MAEPGHEPRVTEQGMTGPYGQRYSWLYWVAILGAFVLLVIDIVGDGAAWTNIGALILVAIAVLLRPGGLRGPNRAG